jgi:hypothetical protein
MAERAPESREQLPVVEAHEALEKPKSPEHHTELVEKDAAERQQHLEAARSKLEKHPEPQAKQTEVSKEASTNLHPTSLDKLYSYKQTMQSLQRRLPTFSRSFSKVIHNPVVEKTSEILGATVVRPSVTLGATTTALLVGGITYWTAKTYGFAISGSEMLFALLLGGIIGFVVELAIKAFGRRN